MRLEQQVGSDSCLHPVRGQVGETRLRVFADIRVRPPIEAAFLNTDQIV